AHSMNDNLIVRAADVHLKERRPLVLMVRETPLHAGHLKSMHELSLYGAVILPPVPGFYILPKTIDDLVDHSVGKALDQLGVDPDLFPRWAGPKKARATASPRSAKSCSTAGSCSRTSSASSRRRPRGRRTCSSRSISA